MSILRYISWVLVLTSMLSFNSCQLQRARRLVADGQVAATGYVRAVPLIRYGEWLIVEVQLGDREKPYRFLYDTGAITVLKPRIAQELGLVPQVQRPIGSANGQSRTLPFVRLPRCTVGGIAFEDIAAVLLDLDTSPELSCLNEQIDGILGANMMRLAAWQIDYAASTLTFSDRLDALPTARAGQAVAFTPTHQGSPKVRVSLWGATMDATLDTGKSGGIGLSAKAWKTQPYRQDTIPHVRGYGRMAVGAFGAREDTLVLAQARGILLDQWRLDTALVVVAPARKNLIGNGFMKHYRVTLDWRSRMAYLVQHRPVPTARRTLGLGYTLQDSSLVVSFVYEGSVAARSGLQPGSRILQIGVQKVERLSPNAFCRIREEGLLPADVDSVVVHWRTTGGLPQVATLRREPLW